MAIPGKGRLARATGEISGGDKCDSGYFGEENGEISYSDRKGEEFCHLIKIEF